MRSGEVEQCLTSGAIGVNPGGRRGRDPQILKWVRVREGKEWEWEGKTPMFQNRLTLLSGATN
jgi:hypothetical protein